MRRDHFSAPEIWHPPGTHSELQFVVEPPGPGFVHPVTPEEVRGRLALLPAALTSRLEVVQFSPMTRKRRQFPCYGMQWGHAIYLYPIEETLVELYVEPPNTQQRIEARMFGAVWGFDGTFHTLTWTRESIRDFYLNNVLIHELAHVLDERNTRSRDRERFANAFAIEWGYRPSRRGREPNATTHAR